jgi:hypothetical protein
VRDTETLAVSDTEADAETLDVGVDDAYGVIVMDCDTPGVPLILA